MYRGTPFPPKLVERSLLGLGPGFSQHFLAEKWLFWLGFRFSLSVLAEKWFFGFGFRVSRPCLAEKCFFGWGGWSAGRFWLENVFFSSETGSVNHFWLKSGLFCWGADSVSHFVSGMCVRASGAFFSQQLCTKPLSCLDWAQPTSRSNCGAVAKRSMRCKHACFLDPGRLTPRRTRARSPESVAQWAYTTCAGRQTSLQPPAATLPDRRRMPTAHGPRHRAPRSGS